MGKGIFFVQKILEFVQIFGKCRDVFRHFCI